MYSFLNLALQEDLALALSFNHFHVSVVSGTTSSRTSCAIGTRHCKVYKAEQSCNNSFTGVFDIWLHFLSLFEMLSTACLKALLRAISVACSAVLTAVVANSFLFSCQFC